MAISIGQTLSEAEDGAEDATRRSGNIAEIWLDDKLICTVYPPENFEYPLCGACGEPASCEWGNVHGVRLVCNECFYALRDAEAVLHG
ncbi:hypothetical protein IIA79_02520 [bacterium]|nr:hypothetical protein [bacterium]